MALLRQRSLLRIRAARCREQPHMRLNRIASQTIRAAGISTIRATAIRINITYFRSLGGFAGGPRLIVAHLQGLGAVASQLRELFVFATPASEAYMRPSGELLMRKEKWSFPCI